MGACVFWCICGIVWLVADLRFCVGVVLMVCFGYFGYFGLVYCFCVVKFGAVIRLGVLLRLLCIILIVILHTYLVQVVCYRCWYPAVLAALVW